MMTSTAHTGREETWISAISSSTGSITPSAQRHISTVRLYGPTACGDSASMYATRTAHFSISADRHSMPHTTADTAGTETADAAGITDAPSDLAQERAALE